MIQAAVEVAGKIEVHQVGQQVITRGVIGQSAAPNPQHGLHGSRVIHQIDTRFRLRFMRLETRQVLRLPLALSQESQLRQQPLLGDVAHSDHHAPSREVVALIVGLHLF